MEKVRHDVQSNVVKNPQKREALEKAEAMRELREVMKKIELHKNYDDEWDALWNRKRQLRSILNPQND